MADKKITILVEAITKGFDSSIKTSTDNVKKLEKANKDLTDSVSGISSALTSLAGATIAALSFRELARGIASSVKEASSAEAALAKLGSAMRSTGAYTDSSLETFKAFAAQLQKTTKFDDDAIISQLGLAKSFGLTNKQAMLVVDTATNLASAMGTDLESATRELSGTFNGAIGRLGKLNPTLGSLTEAQLKAGQATEILNKQFAGTASGQLDTFTGSVAQVENAWGDLKQALGEIIISNPVVIQGFRQIKEWLVGLTDSIAAHRLEWKRLVTEGMLTFLSVADKVVKGMKFVIENGVPFLNLIIDITRALAVFGGLVGTFKTISLVAQVVSATNAMVALGASASALIAALGGPWIVVIAAVGTALASLAYAVGIFDSNIRETALDLTDATDAVDKHREAISKLQATYKDDSTKTLQAKLAGLKKSYNDLQQQIFKMAEGPSKTSAEFFLAEIFTEIQAVDNLIKDKQKEATAAAKSESAKRREYSKARLLAERDLAALETDLVKQTEEDKLLIIAQAFGATETLAFQSQMRLNIINGESWKNEIDLEEKYSKAKIAIRTKALDRIEEIRKAREESEKNALEERERNLVDFANIENDIARTTSDENLEYLRQQLGLEETLTFLSLQRKLQMEGKYQEAKALEEKKYQDAHKKELVTAATATTAFGETPIFDSLSNTFEKLWGKLPDWSKQILNGIIEVASAIADAVVMVADASKYIFSGEFIKDLTEVVKDFGDIPTSFVDAFRELDKTLDPSGEFVKSLNVGLYQIVNAVPTFINQIIDRLPEVVNKVVEGIGSIAETLFSSPEGEQSRFQKLTDAFLAAAEKIIGKLIEEAPRLISQLLEAGGKIIDSILKVLPVLIDKLPAIFEEVFKQLPVIFDKILKALPELIRAVFKVLPDLISSMADALPELLVSLADNLPDIMVAIIEGVAEALPIIIEKLIDSFLIKGGLERIAKALFMLQLKLGPILVEALFNSAVKMVTKLGEVFKDALGNVGKSGILKEMGIKISDSFKKELGKMGPVLKKLGEDLFKGFNIKFSAVNYADYGDQIYQGFWTAWNKYKNIFEDAGTAIWTAFKELWDEFYKIFADAGTLLWTSFKELWDSFVNIFADAGTSLWTAFKTLWDSFYTIFADAGTSIWTSFKTLWDSFVNIFADAGNSLWTSFKTKWDEFYKIFAEAGNSIYDGFKTLWDASLNIFSNAGQALYNNFKSLWDQSSNIFSNAGNDLYNGFKSLWEQSSNIFTQAGTNLYNGFKTLWDSASGIFSAAGTAIYNAFSAIGSYDFASLGTRIWNALKDGLTSGFNIFSDFGTTIWNALRNGLNTGFNIFSDFGTTIWNAFKNGLGGFNFTDLGGKIWNGLNNGLGSFGRIIENAFNAINPSNLISKVFQIDFAGRGDIEKRLGIDVPFNNFAVGGFVGGIAKTAGDSLKNDIVPAVLSPGEYVLPRTVVDTLGGAAANLDPWELVKRLFWERFKGGLGFANGGFINDSMSSMNMMSAMNKTNIGSSNNGMAVLERKFDMLIAATAIDKNITVQIDGKNIATATRKVSNQGFKGSLF